MKAQPKSPFAAVLTTLLAALIATTATLAQTADPRGVKIRGSELETVLGADAAIPRYHALVIGINRYRHWQDLRNARTDAEEVAGLLSSRYGFQAVTTLYDEQATRDGIAGALRRLTEQLGASDALLVFYAGHGYFDKLLNRGYWVPHEARERAASGPATTDWFSNNELQDFVAALRARHVLVVSDSCFSGSLFRGGVPDLSDKANAWYRRAIQQPSRWGISSGDLELVPDNSIFARQFVNALQYPLKLVFSASDLAGRIKVEVAGATGTQPLFGRLQAARDSQFGEFIFLDFGAGPVPLATPPPPTQPPVQPPAVAAPLPSTPASAGPVAGRNWTSPATGMEFVWIEALKIWVGKYEVTNGEYSNKESGHDSKSYESSGGLFRKARSYTLNGERQPVVYVNFEDAKAYAAWLTERDKAQLGGLLYRVPSEQEFMTYAQCGDGREYPWGNNWPPLSGQAGNYSGQETPLSWKISGYNDGHPVTCDVEKSWANPWGLYGVGGNVWEACASDSSGGSFGAWRGASWYRDRQDNLRCAYRFGYGGSYRFNYLGFRLVLSR